MIPVLYDTTETTFASNGIGRLADAIECTVTEERNGVYELFLSYPITGQHFNEIQHSRIISAVPADGKDPQPFRIYRIEKPIDGICSIYAEHISYELNHIPVMPFTASSVSSALSGLVDNAAQSCPFTTWTDKGTSGTFTLATPQPFRALLGGVRGSILDSFGTGEYEFDKYLVRLWQNRGYDTGATIRYGKNLSDLTQDENIRETITGICPYWYNQEDGTIVTLPEKAVWASTAANFPYLRTAVIDFSTEWEEAPTVEELRVRAQQYITDNNIGIPKCSIDVEFVPLWQADGASLGTPSVALVLPAYVDLDTLKNVDGTVSGDTLVLSDARFDVTYNTYRVLERINLCDTVTIEYPALGVSYKAEVVKTEYNVLLDRYNSLEIGDPKTSLADTIVGISTITQAEIAESESALRQFVNHQTALITGGLGGYVVFRQNEATGYPDEILIMDSPDMASAHNVIRMNKAGIGFSTSGYAGPFTSAWTIDGVFNADFISAGTMLANRIMGGTLTLGGLNNESGVLNIQNDANEVTGLWDKNGIIIDGTQPYDGEGTRGSLEIDLINGFIVSGKNRVTTTGTSFEPINVDLGSLEFHYYDTAYHWVAAITPGGISIERQVRSGGTASPTIELSLDSFALQGPTKRLEYSVDGGWLQMDGNFSCSGTKSRRADADDFGKRLLYCYETPSPVFGDIGEGVIDETGTCYVFLDPVFAETITTEQYQVFLQRYGAGDCFVLDRKPGYFVVSGEPGLAFGWELKAKQKGYDQLRLEREETPLDVEIIDYGEEAAQYIIELEEGRIA